MQPQRTLDALSGAVAVQLLMAPVLAVAWAQLIREVIASWRLLLGAALLVLVCTPAVIGLALVILASR